ncbi:MAG TPA: thiamine pyrophosphate-binding protein [Thermomicrobiales bacterium]|nr:thiamine pyrophosphate-binding protein [Thermomicrobiales bacterium]
MAKSTADLLIERLHAWGVDVVFGLPGDGIDDIMEALRTHQDDVRFIQVRHEESAAFAACGYAKYTGRLGVCLATSGPGGLHLLNGLYDAKADQQPVLAITGHTFHDLIGTHYQQDVDLDKIFLDVAEYSERVMGPAHVVNVVDQAVKTALGRRAVSHITVPKDIQGWTTDDAMRSAANVPRHSADLFAPAYGMPPQPVLQEAADVINAGSKVAILAGRAQLPRRGVAVGGPGRGASRQAAPRQGGRAGRQPFHHRRHRPPRHGPVARRAAGVRHAGDPRQQLSPTWSSIRRRGRRRRSRSTSARPESACAIPSRSGCSAIAKGCWGRCCRRSGARRTDRFSRRRRTG